MPIFMPNGAEYRAPEPERAYLAKAIDLGGQSNTTTIEAIVGAASEIADREVYWQIYVRHPWIRTCVDIIAETVAGAGFDVQNVDGDNSMTFNAAEDKRVTDMRIFFRNAFPRSTVRRELMKACVDHNVFGVAYWRKKRAGRVVVGLERLDPRNCMRSKDLDSFLLRKPNQSITSAEVIKLDDVIEMGNGIGDPREGGLSPLESLDLTVATDMAVRTHRNAFFSNGATSGSVLINKSADKHQVEAVDRQLKSEKTGRRNAYKTLLLTGDWEVSHLAQTGKNDFDFVKASGISREEVMMVYRVPPGKLFINSGSLGSAGKSEDDATFQENAVLPLEERIYEALTIQMLSAEWGIDDLEIVPKRRAQMRFEMFDAAAELVKFGGTANEARSLVNLQPLPDDGMDKALFITSRQPVLEEELDSSASGNTQEENNVTNPAQSKKKDEKR